MLEKSEIPLSGITLGYFLCNSYAVIFRIAESNYSKDKQRKKGERDRERERERQTDRDEDRDREHRMEIHKVDNNTMKPMDDQI